MKNENVLFNGIIYDKKQGKKNKSNNYLTLTENRFKSNELKKKNNKLNFLHNSNNSNNPTLSNGESDGIHKNKNKYKYNYNLFKKRLILNSRKEKKNSIKDKNKRKPKSETSKNLQKFLNSNNNNNDISDEEKIKIKKDFEKKINKYTRRTNKSRTIYQHNSGKGGQYNNTFFKFMKSKQELVGKNLIKQNQVDTIEEYEAHNVQNKNKRSGSFSNKLRKDKNRISHPKYINDSKMNVQLPFLGFYKPIISDKQHFSKLFDNNKNLYKSVNFKDKSSINLINPNKYSMSIKSLNLDNNLKNKQSDNIITLINKSENKFSKLFRMQTLNDTDNTKKSNLISTKLLKNYKLYNNKKNNFLKKLKEQLKEQHPKDLIDEWKIDKKNEEISSSLKFMENKINEWTSATGSSTTENEQKIIFNGNEGKYTKEKEKKYIKRIVRDFLKSISSVKDISAFYFKYHKGIIEKNILIYLQKEFFDISLPSYLFEYKCNRLYLSKIQKKPGKRSLLRHKTNDGRNIISNLSNKKGRRFSVEQFRKKSIENNYALLPLTDIQTKYTLYFYYLDMDIDNDNNNQKLEHDDKICFLKLLRGNLNNTEIQDLLINKFITNYIKKNGTKNKVLSYNRKKSIKNNIISNKVTSVTNDSLKNSKMPLFKNNFFLRNEIKRASSKMENIKKKKSVLEYNLLFDPNLKGYNNLITDTNIIFEPNIERTIINKRKIKELQELKNKQLISFFISSGGMKTDKNIIVMKTLDIKNQYNHKNKGNINSLISSIKDCNYDSFVKFYRACNCGPNAFDKDGNSLLSLAVKSSCMEIVNFLLDEKANPNIQNVSIFII